MVQTDFPWRQVLAVYISCIGTISDGFQFGWTSPFIPKIAADKENYDISEEEASYFSVFPLIAMILSTFLFSKLSDVIGRRNTLFLLSIPHVISWILIMFAKHVYMFYAARFISGFGSACNIVIFPLYVGEITCPNVRGCIGSSFIPFSCLGIFIMNIVGSYFSVKEVAFICLPVPIIFFVLFLFVPESPYFYLMKGRNKDAERSLKWLLNKEDVNKELEELARYVTRQHSETGTWSDIFTVKSNRKAFTAALILRMSQPFSGFVVFTCYTQYIFEKSGISIGPQSASIIYVGICIPVYTCGGFIGALFKRRTLFISSLIFCAIILLSEGIYFFVEKSQPYIDLTPYNWFPLTGMILYIVFSSYGIATLPILMFGELFSISIKTKASTLLLIIFFVMIAIVNFLFYLLESNFGLFTAFLFFGCSSVLVAILAYYFLPETKGKSLEEIQEILKRRKVDKTNTQITEISMNYVSEF